jgi:murein DD-endopeptidase MepM/ murein hydrolase activator NlpD
MLVIAAMFLVVAVLSSLATRVLFRPEPTANNAKLVRANSLLSAELKDLRSRVEQLGLSLEQLAALDEGYRLLAGLEPIDPDVQRVGIGGPGTATLGATPLWDVDPGAATESFAASARVDELLRRARLLSFSWREASDSLSRAHDRLASTPSILPTAGRVTSSFTRNRWHPLLGKPRPHFGLDIVARTGSPIAAAARGRVSFVGFKGDYGLTIEIDHGYRTVTRYAHASRSLVRRGQIVERGHVIGRVGSTGLAIGPHLHYEVLVNGRPANPRRFIFEAAAIPD